MSVPGADDLGACILPPFSPLSRRPPSPRPKSQRASHVRLPAAHRYPRYPAPRLAHHTRRPRVTRPTPTYWRWIEDTARLVAARYGYQPLEIPAYEHTELFARGVGAGTDIVEKEMFTFRPRPDSDSLTLRPEFTAGFARAYLQNGMGSWPQPVKVYTIGPVFRYERPQANRFRQHSQFNAECLGEADPLADFEIMSMLWDYFTALGLEGLSFQLNTIGSSEARKAYVREVLVPWLEARREDLPEIDRERLAKNPLRVFDSKEERTREMLADAPVLADHIDEESRAHFAALRGYLDDNGLAYRIDPRLVRGLDYYARTVFEIHVEGIGAQSALCGGGRYDGLVELLGGTHTPGVGFGAGIERAIAVLRLKGIRPPALPAPPAFAVYFDEETKRSAVALCATLRRAGIGAHSDFGQKNLRKQMKAASRSGARFALILGDAELESGTVMVKDLTTGRAGGGGAGSDRGGVGGASRGGMTSSGQPVASARGLFGGPRPSGSGRIGHPARPPGSPRGVGGDMTRARCVRVRTALPPAFLVPTSCALLLAGAASPQAARAQPTSPWLERAFCTERVSVDAAGAASPGEDQAPTISADGRLIVFGTTAALEPGDVNENMDLYLRDRVAGLTRRVTWSEPRARDAGVGAGDAFLSADGQVLIYATRANRAGLGEPLVCSQADPAPARECIVRRRLGRRAARGARCRPGRSAGRLPLALAGPLGRRGGRPVLVHEQLSRRTRLQRSLGRLPSLGGSGPAVAHQPCPWCADRSGRQRLHRPDRGRRGLDLARRSLEPLLLDARRPHAWRRQRPGRRLPARCPEGRPRADQRGHGWRPRQRRLTLGRASGDLG